MSYPRVTNSQIEIANQKQTERRSFNHFGLRPLERSDVGSVVSSGRDVEDGNPFSRRPERFLRRVPESVYSISIEVATTKYPILPNTTPAFFLFFLCNFSVRTTPQSTAHSTHTRIGPCLSPLRPLHGFCCTFLPCYIFHSNYQCFEKISNFSGQAIPCGLPGGTWNSAFSETLWH